MHKVFKSLVEKGYELQGQQHIVTISKNKKNVLNIYSSNMDQDSAIIETI